MSGKHKRNARRAALRASLNTQLNAQLNTAHAPSPGASSSSSSASAVVVETSAVETHDAQSARRMRSGPPELLWVTNARTGERWATHARAEQLTDAPDAPLVRYVRDAVTGERVAVEQMLSARALYRLRDDATLYVHRRMPRSVYTPSRADTLSALTAPSALHVAQTDGRLGGKRYSSPFARRLAHTLPHDVAEAQRLKREWWRDPYVVHGLTRHMPYERLVVALLRIALDWSMEQIERGVDVHEVVAGLTLTASLKRCSRQYIARCEHDARRIVRQHYYPRDDRRDDSRDEQAKAS